MSKDYEQAINKRGNTKVKKLRQRKQKIFLMQTKQQHR